MKKIQTTLLAIVACLLLTGCDQLVSYFATPDNLDIVSNKLADRKEPIEVHQVTFSPDNKTFTLTTRMKGDIGPYGLTDSTKVRIDVRSNISGVPENEHSRPRLVKVINTKAQNIAKKDVQVLALIDLTQPQEVLDRIKSNIIELSAVFNDTNLYVAFAYGDSISQTLLATEYVINKYFVMTPEPHVYLYRAIVQKYDEMHGHQAPWTHAKHRVLLVFSDSEVYNNNTNIPFDPDHFTYESEMVERGNHPDRNLLVNYAYTGASPQGKDNMDMLVLRHFCEMTHGIYMHPYNGNEFKNSILRAFSISPDANLFVFENPDGKVYRGGFEKLTVDVYSKEADTLITSFSAMINKGDFYNPIIVHGMAAPVVILIGIIIAAFIALFLWLLLQYVVPFIRYKLFCRKYVVRYSGHDMGVGGNIVAESCYLCKQPFKTGDEIVVKCSHTMHKDCWDENGYHCTEYSDRCKHGSHYYNHKNLSDRHNAPFFTKWILAGVIATTLAWIQFVSTSHRVTEWLTTKLSLLLTGIQADSPEAAQLFDGNTISPLPSFGFSFGLCMTLAVALLSTKLINVRHDVVSYLIRALVAAIACYIIFLLINVLATVAHMGGYTFLIAWIPWVVSAVVIAYCGTYGTRVVLRRRLIIPCILITIAFMYLWSLFYSYFIDYRIMLLLAFLFYGCGLTVCLATVAPRSERFFLRVEGAVKGMDVAIYKWFRNAPDRVVTIGKSVDCSLQLSWDVSGSIAPCHAEIRLRHNTLYLVALEEGVICNNKPLEVGKEVWLNHGAKFSIANTTFTYIEKDIS